MPVGNVITQARLDNITAGFQTIFNKVLATRQSAWARVATKTTSVSAKEIYAWLSDNFGMKELIGEMVIDDLSASDYELKNLVYYDAKRVSRFDMEDNNLGVYNQKFAMMAGASGRAYDKITFSRLSQGFTNKCWDGKSFYSATHPVGDKKRSTYSNLGTKKFSAQNFKDAITAMQGFVNAAGDPWGFGIDPAGMIVVCSPTNQWDVKATFELQKLPNDANNPLYQAAKVLVSPYLATADEWHVLDCGQEVLPLLLQEREAVKLNTANRPDDTWVKTNNAYLYIAQGRYNGGYGIPAMAWGSTGADAA